MEQDIKRAVTCVLKYLSLIKSNILFHYRLQRKFIAFITFLKIVWILLDNFFTKTLIV